MFGGSQHQAELRHIGAGRGELRHGGGAFLRHLAERQRDALLRTLAPDRDIHRSAGRHTADLHGEVAGILDRIAVHGGDDIARLDVGLGGGTIRRWFGNQRACSPSCRGFRQWRSDRLNLDANPAAATTAAPSAAFAAGNIGSTEWRKQSGPTKSAAIARLPAVARRMRRRAARPSLYRGVVMMLTSPFD